MDYIQRLSECSEEDRLLVANIFLQRAAYWCNMQRIDSEKLLRETLDERRTIDLNHVHSFNRSLAAYKTLLKLATDMPGISEQQSTCIAWSILAKDVEERTKQYLAKRLQSVSESSKNP